MNKTGSPGWQIINEFKSGLLIWMTDDGRVVQDSDGNVMNIEINNVDDQEERKTKVDALRKAARAFGVDGGHAQFLSGNRRISDEEYANQLARRDAGLIPDPFDRGAINDEVKRLKK